MHAPRDATASFDVAPRPTAPPVAIFLAPGTKLGPYRLVSLLATGGMGQVWVAKDERNPRVPVAVKTIRADLAGEQSFRDMFLREAALAAAIKHPNVLRVDEVGDEGGLLYEVMPLVHGGSLADIMTRHGARAPNTGLPWQLVTRIALDALRGLHAAHTMRDPNGLLLGLVHRDVSPQNLLVDLDGHTRLVDFGVAKALHVAQDRTATGSIKGKAAYLSPEQVQGRSIDHRSDLFSMGTVLWEALTGARLFRGSDAFMSMRRVLDEPIPPLTERVPSLPPAISHAVQRALSRNPATRFTNAEEMAHELERGAGGQLASPVDVASLVTTLLGAEITARKEAYAKESALRPAENNRKFLVVAGAGLGVVVLSVALGAIAMLRRSSTPPSTIDLPAPTTEVTQAPAPSSVVVVSTPLAAAPSSSAVSTASAESPAPKPSTKSKPSPPPSTGSQPRLPYEDNPFAR